MSETGDGGQVGEGGAGRPGVRPSSRGRRKGGTWTCIEYMATLARSGGHPPAHSADEEAKGFEPAHSACGTAMLAACQKLWQWPVLGPRQGSGTPHLRSPEPARSEMTQGERNVVPMGQAAAAAEGNNRPSHCSQSQIGPR